MELIALSMSGAGALLVGHFAVLVSRRLRAYLSGGVL
jgi:hypothetical protein